ncbi:GDSL-type esterase/lipase family protein [Nocardia sp. NPDC005978]|uniref:GDSL-type esterase/lipase family protein n=1 Tax=Nocardia sp. NPDC005978 TaxID=3156725 RepID=UPI0033BF02A3
MSTQDWIAGFRTPLVNPAEEIRLAESREFAGETLRQVVRLAGGGSRLRVRLSNRYAATELVIGAARVAPRENGDAIVSADEHVLRFGGATAARIPAGGEIVSDPVDLAVTAGTDIVLSLYFPEPTGPAAFSQLPGESGWVVAGDHTGAGALPGAEETTSRYFLTGVDVFTAAATPVLVAFGDSWFEGVGSTHGANRRSVDVLNARLTRGWAVNQGISGSRLLSDQIGERGLTRFDRDVLAVPGVAAVWVNFGINDLILAGAATAAELIAGYTELARRSHAAGLPIYVNTIGPFAGAIYPGLTVADGLPVRTEVNAWLRDSPLFDAVFDVAAAVEDPARPGFIRPDYDSGDGMHLNDAGARAMAETATIPAFTETPTPATV